MSRHHQLAGVTAICLGLVASPAEFAGQTLGGAPDRSTLEQAVTGKVHDEDGRPLSDAVVSMFGADLKDGFIATTNQAGEFEIPNIPPGMYQLRAYLDGFLPSQEATVVVIDGVKEAAEVAMRLVALAPAIERSEQTQKKVSELKWLLRHQKRNVLQDRWVPLSEAATGESSETADVVASHRSALAADALAMRGTFGVLAAGHDGQTLRAVPGSGAGLDAGVAFAELEIPNATDDGGWFVQAQFLESALASWAGSAQYHTAAMDGHQLTTQVRYGKYMYGDVDAFRPPEAGFLNAQPTQSMTEWFGGVEATDNLQFGRTEIEAGLAYDYFDYLDRAGYWSPTMSVRHSLDPDGKTVITGAAGYHLQAPGAEDITLLSRLVVADVFGTGVDRGRGLKAQSTARYRVGLERELDEEMRVSVTVFQEDSRDQLAKIFAAGDEAAGLTAGYFRVANRGDFRTRGVGVAVNRRVGNLEGTLGYTYGVADSLTPTQSRIVVRRDGLDDEIHDVTTAVATTFDRTKTRVRCAVRLVRHPGYMQATPGDDSAVFDSRFNFQVFQILPFVGGNSTEWEVMVAIRNLFYDDLERASFLDEISVVDAPRRVIGGLSVRF